jgi:hypothetical protein
MSNRNAQHGFSVVGYLILIVAVAMLGAICHKLQSTGLTIGVLVILFILLVGWSSSDKQ